MREVWDENQRYVLSPEQTAVDYQYWQEHLRAYSQPLRLTGHGEPQANRMMRLEFDLPAEQQIALNAFTQEHAQPSGKVILAVLIALLHRLTGEKDIIVGIVISGRTRSTRSTPTTMSTILPLRVALDEDTTLEQLLQTVSILLRSMLRHRRLRGDILFRDLLGREDQSYQISVNLMEAEYQTAFAGTVVRQENIALGAGNGLHLAVQPGGRSGLPCRRGRALVAAMISAAWPQACSECSRL